MVISETYGVKKKKKRRKKKEEKKEEDTFASRAE